MTEADSGAVVRKFFDAMNAHDLDRVAALAGEEVEFVDVASGEEIRGRERWREYCERYLKGFPDLRLELTNLVAAGDSAFAEAVAVGTHDGALQTPAGAIPPTGRKIEVRFCVVARARDGKIADSREHYDSMTLMTQLGLVPEPA